MEKVQKGQMQTLTSLRDFVLCAKKVLTFAKLKLCERQQLQNGSIALQTLHTIHAELLITKLSNHSSSPIWKHLHMYHL